MERPGSETNPLRVAVVGSGPTGFYAAAHLLREKELHCQVDILDSLPTPYGLVRGGVAPDHQKTKSVIKAYARTASDPRCRFYGNVTVGEHVSVEELRRYYHAIIYCSGAQTDRRMGIPGEDLTGSYTSTEFVAWYNGHPDFRDHDFDLSRGPALIVGVGNVAVDVARILCRTAEELRTTDIADHALEALARSGIDEVIMVGRRGAAQAAFTQAEAEELGELPAADIHVPRDEAELDDLSRAAVAADRVATKKVETIQEFAARPAGGRARRLTLRFLRSPVEILGDDDGHVHAVRLVRNELVAREDGSLAARATGDFEELPVDIVFRSVGYRGVPIPGVPFDNDRGIIPNDCGRVVDPDSSTPVRGEYAAGWIKRGPRGVIGTNKPDALETVRCLLVDLGDDSLLTPDSPDRDTVETFLRERQPDLFTFEDWQRLDELEIARGAARSAPRAKFTRVSEMLEALGRT